MIELLLKNNMFILLACMYLAFYDDFAIQSHCLSKLKQKCTWDDYFSNHPDVKDKMKYDYIVALVVHSFMWSFLMMLPITIGTVLYANNRSSHIFMIIIINTILHALVDNTKANVSGKRQISLGIDQQIHLTQILATVVWYFSFIRG